jgi:hypothetical protein
VGQIGLLDRLKRDTVLRIFQMKNMKYFGCKKKKGKKKEKKIRFEKKFPKSYEAPFVKFVTLLCVKIHR